MLLPVTLFIEGHKIFKLTEIVNYKEGIKQTLISGLLFYLYNEVSFKALNNLNPVSHALANTLKRVVIIVSSVLFFGEKITPVGMVGAALAICGVFAYSWAGIIFKPQKKKSE
jgi:solute carrier family 35 protein E1